MKSQTKKLQLNKETVAKLNDDSMSQVRGGALANAKGGLKAGFWTFEGKCTDGCTDGCGTIWNCTKADCTHDCPKETDKCTKIVCPSLYTCTCL